MVELWELWRALPSWPDRMVPAQQLTPWAQRVPESVSTPAEQEEQEKEEQEEQEKEEQFGRRRAVPPIFNPDGGYLMKFGNGGTGAGQFDRPAGVCVNSLDQIIVADKDNHRIQVFANDGTFAFMFGERGRPTSMFNYPWGVAVDSKDQIAVSDTRNHRVQIFSPTGQYLYKCGFDTAYFYKHLDSPRGVCFMPDGRLLISDFNNHRLVMMTDSQHAEAAMKCFGGEGDVSGMFCRPQGLTLDHEGNLLVCDSRNNRIQVFELHEMKTIAVIGSKSSIDGSRTRGHSQIVLSSPSGHRSDVLFASTPRAERGLRTENPFSNVVLSPIMLDSLRISESALSQWTIMPGHLLPPPTFHLAKNDNGDDGHDEWTLQQKIPIPPNVRGRCNFIGRILGPRGISVRQMEAETGCSIVIRGQGSIKDPDRAARLHGVVGWEHLDEPLHCLITASAADKSQARRKLDGAVSAVLNLLNNTNNDHKKQQLVQLAIINGTYRPDEPTPTTE
ncbi:unnamed protein product, partial [Mesorhabditis spiculigera]